MHDDTAIDRVLSLFEALVLDQGASPASAIIASLGVPASTGRRHLAALLRHGMIVRVARGRYVAGKRMQRLAAMANSHAAVIGAARPQLLRLSEYFGCTAHLGVFENEMVTYLLKLGGYSMFTREQDQLEAYCTGIGKALLMQLSSAELAEYLTSDLIPITKNTITDSAHLREVLREAQGEGFAVDNCEMAEDLFCVAVPLPVGGPHLYALSLSGQLDQLGGETAAVAARLLAEGAAIIMRRLLTLDEEPMSPPANAALSRG